MKRIYLFLCYRCQAVYAGLPSNPPVCANGCGAKMLEIHEHQTAFYID